MKKVSGGRSTTVFSNINNCSKMIWKNKPVIFLLFANCLLVSVSSAYAVVNDCYVVVEGNPNNFVTGSTNGVWMQEMLGGFDETYQGPYISGPFSHLNDGHRPYYIGGGINSLRLWYFNEVARWGYTSLAPDGWGTFGRIYVNDYNALLSGENIPNYKGTLPFGADPSKLYPNGCSDLPSQQPDQIPNLDTGRPECNDQTLMN